MAIGTQIIANICIIMFITEYAVFCLLACMSHINSYDLTKQNTHALLFTQGLFRKSTLREADGALQE